MTYYVSSGTLNLTKPNQSTDWEYVFTPMGRILL